MIVALTLDAGTLPSRSPDLDAERSRVIADLLAENSFALKSAEGPYRLNLSLNADGLVINVANDAGSEDIRMPLSPLKRHMNDYQIVCDNFYKTAKAGELHRLEAIDAGRRSIHDEAAEALADSLSHKVTLDKTTARRLFSLVYVLHARTISN